MGAHAFSPPNPHFKPDLGREARSSVRVSLRWEGEQVGVWAKATGIKTEGYDGLDMRLRGARGGLKWLLLTRKLLEISLSPSAISCSHTHRHTHCLLSLEYRDAHLCARIHSYAISGFWGGAWMAVQVAAADSCEQTRHTVKTDVSCYSLSEQKLPVAGCHQTIIKLLIKYRWKGLHNYSHIWYFAEWYGAEFSLLTPPYIHCIFCPATL